MNKDQLIALIKRQGEQLDTCQRELNDACGRMVRAEEAAKQLREVLEKFVRGGHSVGASEWQLRLFERARAALKESKS